MQPHVGRVGRPQLVDVPASGEWQGPLWAVQALGPGATGVYQHRRHTHARWFRFSVPEFSAGSGPLPAEQGGQVETGSALAEGLAEDALGVMEGADGQHDVAVQQQQGAAALPAVQPDEVAVQQGGQVETGSTLAEGLFEDALDGMEGEDAVAVGLDGSQANDDGNGASDGVPHDVTVQQQDEAVPVEQPAKKRRKYGKKCIHCGELIKRNELHFHASQALPADHRHAFCAVRARRRRATGR